MAGKECILVLLDIGYTMNESYSHCKEKKRIDIGVESIKLLIQQKLLFQKSHEICLALFGSHEADDGDMITLIPFEKPDLEFVRALNESKESAINKPSEFNGGDVLKAISKSIELLEQHVGKKKQIKKIFLITNGSGITNYNEEDVKKLAKKAKSTDTRINIIGIDLFDSLEEEELDNYTALSNDQLKYKKLFNLLCRLCLTRYFPSNVAMEIYRQFRTKAIYPVAKYKGTFDISQELKIQVMVYGKTREEKFPSLKKHSLAANTSKMAEEGRINFKREYYVHDDPSMNSIEKDERIRGYYYGKQLVPIPPALEDKLKSKDTEKCLKLLGFTSIKNVPRHHYLTSVDMMIPIDKGEDSKAISALIHALYELEKVAIVRFISRNKYPPRLCCLIPHISAKYECFWVNYLPTVEDIRDYQFTSLKASNATQQKVMGDFIDALDLMNVEDEVTKETYESIKINTTFNPVLQYFYQCLIYRAFENNQKLPELDPLIADYVRPNKTLFEKAKPIIDNLKGTFNLRENELKKSNQKVYWRDMINKEKEKQQELITQEQEVKEQVEGQQEKVKKDLNFDEDIVRVISVVNPIVDFQKMMTEKYEDLVSTAIEQMTKMIMRLIDESFQESLYDKAVDCLEELRKGCVNEDEAPSFNGFLTELRAKTSEGKHASFWAKVIAKGLTLIDNTETKSSTVSFNKAKEFLQQQDQKMAQRQTEDDKRREEEDLLADLEQLRVF